MLAYTYRFFHKIIMLTPVIFCVCTVAFFSFDSRNTSASQLSYEIDFTKENVPLSQIRKGSILGRVFFRSQTYYVYLPWTSSHPNPVFDLYFIRSNSVVAGDPGCTPIDNNSGLGILRWGNTVKETVCNPNETLLTTKGIKGYYTGYGSNGNYQYRITIPQRNLFDLVVNDPGKIRARSGQTVVIPIQSFTQLSLISSGITAATFNQVGLSSLSYRVSSAQPVVFFPSENSSNARVVLPVKTSGAGLAAGSASVDLCLYDGAGLTSSRFMLTLEDQNVSNTSPYFAIYNTTGAGKIDYSVSLTDPSGKPQPVTNGVPLIWMDMQNGGAAQSRLKYVQLPDGTEGRVPCVPSVVTLKVRPVPYNSLQSGKYNGHLNILFTPST